VPFFVRLRLAAFWSWCIPAVAAAAGVHRLHIRKRGLHPLREQRKVARQREEIGVRVGKMRQGHAAGAQPELIGSLVQHYPNLITA
jgi:hypothetical protein